MNDVDDLARSNQQRAVDAWIHHLNAARLDHLLATLAQQDVRLGEALSSIDAALHRIGHDIVDINRGGRKGMHGFIAEVAEAGIGNAREQILGRAAAYQWVDDNGPVDLVRDGVPIQQKFVAAGGRFGLGAIAEHLRKYPDYVSAGGRYQIPSDHFAVIERLHGMSATDAEKLLGRGGEGPSMRDWHRVQAFFREGSVPFEALEPSKLEYAQVQRGSYESTLLSEQNALRRTDRAERDSAHLASRPSLREGFAVTAVSSAVEGGTSFVLALVARRRAGKQLKDFSLDDWQQIAVETGLGTVRGGVRGFSIYAITNVTASSAAVAGSIVTAAFGIAEQANRFRTGEIDETQFLQNAELVSMEAGVSALSSVVGQAVIPIPVLGAVIGNTVGTIMYRSVSSSLSEREAVLLEQYLEEQRLLDARLADEHQALIDALAASMVTYFEVLDRAFSPDVRVALTGSVELALSLGVPADEVLDSAAKTHAYFVD